MGTDGLAKRPWLLLPGTLCTAAVFDGFLDELQVPERHRHAIELNQPSIEDYDNLCRATPQETVICGFSLGAIVAAHQADRLTAHRLLFFGLNPYPDDPEKAQGRHDLARDVADQGGSNAMRSCLPELHVPKPERARADLLTMADLAAPLIGAQTQLALSRSGALPALARAKTSVLIVTGTLDTAAPPDQGRAAADTAPNGWFVSLDGLGHFALLEDPQACARAVLRLEDRLHATS